MTQDDKQFLKEFLARSGFIGIIVGGFILILSLISWGSSPTKHLQETKVVGTYKGCDIIQWHYGALSEYKYFLYCNSKEK